jgi:membrane-bound ClpP family serine protease
MRRQRNKSESYQSIGIVIGIIGIVLGLFGSLVQGWLVWVAIVSIVGIIIVLVNTKHHKNVGIVLIVLGIIGNLLLIIPGAMALRYKPESQSGIRPQSKEEGEK